MPIYKRKPEQVEAWQFEIDTPKPDWVLEAIRNGAIDNSLENLKQVLLVNKPNGGPIPRGQFGVAYLNDWIVRVDNTEFIYTLDNHTFTSVFETTK